MNLRAYKFILKILIKKLNFLIGKKENLIFLLKSDIILIEGLI